jgi:protein gp37
MSTKTKIEWTDTTWNPVVGCTKVSAGCWLCYWMPVHDRRHLAWKEGRWPTAPKQYHQPSTVVQQLWERLEQPFHWRKPRRVFVNSLSDLFHEQLPFEFIHRVFAVMLNTPRHTYQILTKRPERMLEFARWEMERAKKEEDYIPWPLPNVWLGTSVEDQRAADGRIPLLMQVPAAVRFLSCEPLLGAVDLRMTNGLVHGEDAADFRLDWVICGGESGGKARPMHPDWARSLRDQCAWAGVPFFFKQWGEWLPGCQPECPTGPAYRWATGDGKIRTPQYFAETKEMPFARVGKKRAGRLLDGVTHDAFPATEERR